MTLFKPVKEMTAWTLHSLLNLLPHICEKNYIPLDVEESELSAESLLDN